MYSSANVCVMLLHAGYWSVKSGICDFYPRNPTDN